MLGAATSWLSGKYRCPILHTVLHFMWKINHSKPFWEGHGFVLECTIQPRGPSHHKQNSLSGCRGWMNVLFSFQGHVPQRSQPALTSTGTHLLPPSQRTAHSCCLRSSAAPQSLCLTGPRLKRAKAVVLTEFSSSQDIKALQYHLLWGQPATGSGLEWNIIPVTSPIPPEASLPTFPSLKTTGKSYFVLESWIGFSLMHPTSGFQLLRST